MGDGQVHGIPDSAACLGIAVLQPVNPTHYLQTGVTERVSVSSGGAQGDRAAGAPPSLSADGHFVAFASSATNLVPGDDNDAVDVFVRDRWLGTLQRVTGPFGGGFTNPSLSADGLHVVFADSYDELPQYANVYLHERIVDERRQERHDRQYRREHPAVPFDQARRHASDRVRRRCEARETDADADASTLRS